jgi:subtilase family serine protease
MQSRYVARLRNGLLCLVIGSLAASGVRAQAPNHSVDFGGTLSHVTMGPAPGLNASTFTLELWFRRDGTGRSVGTGSGGVTAIPLVTKGRSESDGTSTDVNYFFGIDAITSRLVADFEEGPTGTKPGKNHPVAGATTIERDRWYHAAATYDGATWRLYLNGVEDGMLVVNEPPRSDNTQHAGIGSALNSGGVASGFFDGAIDEVRIWNVARTSGEIQESMNLQLTSAPSLRGRWGLNEGSGISIADSSGNGHHGTLVTSAFYSWANGAPFRSNQAPQAVPNSPANGAGNVPTSPTLSVSGLDQDDDPLTVTFFGGRVPVGSTPDFTIVAIPDTQHYVDDPVEAATFTAQTQWIVANQASKNIAFVTHLGDVVEHDDTVPIEWARADTSLAVLEAGLMKWGLAPGNHDLTSSSVGLYYDMYFPVSRFAGYSWYGGYMGQDPVTDPVDRQNKNNYQLFSVGGLDFIILHLEYDLPTYSVAWADRILKQYPHRRAIISTHVFLHNSGSRPSVVTTRPEGTPAEAVWQQLIGSNCNVFMILNGHYDGEANRTDRNACGQPVHQIVSDYQQRTNGGDGWLRYMTFKPAENKVYVYTYSPTLNGGAGLFETDANSQFVLDYNMQGAVFTQIGTSTVVASGSVTTVTWPDLLKSRAHDWYATVSDGLVTTVGPVSRFTTSSANRAPVADSQSVGASQNVATPIVLTASDADEEPLTYSIVTPPSHGTLTGTAPNVTYTSSGQYSGPDSFTFRVNDGHVDSNIATVSIMVANQPPVSASQAVTTAENTARAITLTASDPENDPLTYAIVSGPAHGTLSGTAPNVVYTPSTNYYGEDSFTFRTNDSRSDSNTATVTITVTPAQFTLAVSTSGNASGTVTSSPAAISCPGGACSASFARDTVVTLTAVPTGDGTFIAWSGACSGTSACVLTITASTSVDASFGVTGRDLVETSVTNPPATSSPGASFAVTDTTRNDGALSTGTTHTQYYLSTNAVKDAGDILLTGSRTVSGLAPGASSTGTATVLVPSATPVGTYRLLACADDRAVVAELNEANNCLASSTSVQLALSDLVVTAVSNPPAEAVPTGRFSVTDTVQNVGLLASPASANRYYLSLDTAVGAGDILVVETRSVPTLGLSATSTGSKTITVPPTTPAEVYYLIVCADGLAAIPELVETNNCRASSTVLRVGWPDLVTSAFSNPPALGAPAGKLPVTDTVLNQGQIGAGTSTTAYYLSTDPVKDGADLLLTGTRSVGTLAPGATSTASRDVTVPSTTPLGTYFLIACADNSLRVAESSELNNCRASTTTVVITLPDLVETVVSDPPPAAAPGASIAVSDSVQNVGGIEVSSSSTAYYLSLNAVRDGGDILLTGARSVPILAPGAISSGGRNVTIPLATAPGVYFLLACADDQVRRLESDESNNCRASATTIQIGQ